MKFLSLSEAVEANVRDGDSVAMEGFTHLIPFAAGHEVIRQAQAPHPDPHDAGHRLRPAHRHGLRRKAHLFLGRKSGRRLAAPHARRGRERLAEAAGDRGALPRRDGECLRGGRRQPAVRGVPRLHRRGPAQGQPEHPLVTCPYTGEKLAAVPAIRPDVAIIHALKADRAGNVLLEGIIGVQKEAVLAAKRSIVTVEEMVDDFGPRSANAVILPAWTVGAVGVRAWRRASVLCARLLQARQRLLQGLGRDRARPRHVPRLDEGERSGTRARGVRARRRAGSAPRQREEAADMAQPYTPTEMMTIAAARALRNDDVCFVGIGAPSAACNLARLTHAPGHHADLRVRHDRHQARACCRSRSATASCATPRSPPCRCRRCSATGCKAGASRVGFLGGAQIDRFANLNTTVVGAYDKPKVRLPGGGGAPEIAVSCGEIFITMAKGKRALRRQARFRHLDRPWRGRRPPRAARAEDQGTDAAHHRSLRVRAGPGDARR